MENGLAPQSLQYVWRKFYKGEALRRNERIWWSVILGAGKPRLREARRSFTSWWTDCKNASKMENWRKQRRILLRGSAIGVNQNEGKEKSFLTLGSVHILKRKQQKTVGRSAQDSWMESLMKSWGRAAEITCLLSLERAAMWIIRNMVYLTLSRFVGHVTFLIITINDCTPASAATFFSISCWQVLERLSAHYLRGASTKSRLVRYFSTEHMKICFVETTSEWQWNFHKKWIIVSSTTVLFLF